MVGLAKRLALKQAILDDYKRQCDALLKQNVALRVAIRDAIRQCDYTNAAENVKLTLSKALEET